MTHEVFTRRQHLVMLARLTGAAAVSSLPFSFASAASGDDKMIIQIFSKHLQWLDYGAMADAVKAMGFDGIDLTVRPGGHVLPEYVKTDLPKAVEAIRKRGLLVQCITTAITGADEPYTEAILSTAASLGISRYRMGWISYHKTQDIMTNLKGIQQQLATLAELNKAHGLRADYQNHAGSNFGSNPWELWYVLKDLPVEFIASRFDVRHAMVEGYQSWANDFRLMAPYIRTLDFKDFRWTADGQIQNVPLGQGLVDFSAYAKMLKQYAVTAPITIHCEYDLGGAQDGRKDIKLQPEQILLAIKKDLGFLRGIMESK